MNLIISCNSFKQLKVEGIDISSFSYYGSTDDYDYNDIKSYNIIGFSLSDLTKTQEVLEFIKTKFSLNPEMCDVEDFAWIREKGEKPPKIGIKFSNGSKGMINPPSIEFQQ